MSKPIMQNHCARPEQVETLIHHLDTGNDVLRTGAVRALAVQAVGSKKARSALLSALLDEDPDVRADAMEALAGFALAEDAEVIRQSLIGDPVREVKIAAIGILTDLKDTNAVPLFRTLVESRAEDEIAWEDENDVWDDWLDVQIAAIEAIGTLKVEDAIDDLLKARDDEYGQNLDVPVFRALANMGPNGASKLLAITQNEDGPARKRGFEALARSNPDFLGDHLDILFNDPAAEIRRLILPLLKAADDYAHDLALHDSDAGIRHDALLLYAPDRPELAEFNLLDKNETVQAAALDLLTLPLNEEEAETLVLNVQAWISTAGAKLAAAAARMLPKIAPALVDETLLKLIGDVSRPLEARIAAVDTLAKLTDAAATERMINFLSNESQQIRSVAVSHLAGFARSGDQTANQVLALAIDSVLLTPDKAVIERPQEDQGPDLATPKADDIHPSLHISPDGNIVPVSVEPGTKMVSSTLEALQITQLKQASDENTSELAEDTPEESGLKRRKRRAVEGPDTIALDLAIRAMNIAADVPDSGIAKAIIEATKAVDDERRLQAYKSLLLRSKTLPVSEDAHDSIKVGLTDHLPAVRSVAAQLAVSVPKLADSLEEHLDDEDVIMRAVAVRATPNLENSLAGLNDPALIVRRAALEKTLSTQNAIDANKTFDHLLGSDWIDTMSEAIKGSSIIFDRSFQQLSDKTTDTKTIHVLLQALGKKSVDAVTV